MNRRSIQFPLAAIATALAAGAAGAGLLIPGLYRDTPYWAQQARGTDLATLLVAVPVLALGLWAARGGSAAGGLAVFAGLLYLVYSYAIFAFSVAMNPLTAVHTRSAARAWSLILMTRDASLAESGTAIGASLSRRASGMLLIAVAALFSLSGSVRSARRRRPACCRLTSSRPACRPTRSTRWTSRSSCRCARSPASGCCVGRQPALMVSRC